MKKNTQKCLVYMTYGKCDNLTCKFEHEEVKTQPQVIKAPAINVK